MTTTRAAAYLGGGALLVAWLAAAGGVPFQESDAPARDRAAVRTSGQEDLQALAGDVQAQAGRLRERLARAPVPQQNPRNPFAFGMREHRAALSAPARPAAALPPPMLDAPSPALALIGVAEEPSPEGLHRTAMIAGADDTFYMVMEGQAVADRYRVITIGTDAVELKDLLTGAVRRLALR